MRSESVNSESVPSVRPAGGPLAAPAIVAACRALAATWRYRPHGRDVLDDALAQGPAILAFWHGEQLPMVIAHAGLGLLGVASHSRDGELLARIIGRLGYSVVRGSTSRGGSRALRECVAAVTERGQSPALAVDGPRGPLHVPHRGAVALSALTGRPIVFGVSVARPAVRLSSWDRFVVPLPGARIDLFYGRMEPPPRSALEGARVELARRMEALADGPR